MRIYLIFDTATNFYYIENARPFFYGFTDYGAAEAFCRARPGTRAEEQLIEDEDDDDFLTETLYQRGFKGGYVNDRFLAINQSNPELIKFIPENAGLLNLILFRETHKEGLVKNQRFYFFAMVTDEGYLAFANTGGYIFGFSDIDNMDTKLTRQLFAMGYEVVKHYMDEAHKYILNANRNTQCLIGEGFAFEE